MKLFRKKAARHPSVTRAESLARIPVKNSRIVQERLPGGEILITYAAPVGALSAAVIRYLGRGSGQEIPKKVQLDGMGSEVWELIDGRRTVRRLIDIFANAHNVPAQEAEVAVTQFVRSLGRRGLIGLK
jgi:hypothetical protein